MDGMEVRVRILLVGRRNEGILCSLCRCVDKASWSKTLRSLSWTRKITQVGSGGVDLDGPYAVFAAARLAVKVDTAVLGGGWPMVVMVLCSEELANNGCGGYATGCSAEGYVARCVCISATRQARPPNDEDMVLNSTCLSDGGASSGVCSM